MATVYEFEVYEYEKKGIFSSETHRGHIHRIKIIPDSTESVHQLIGSSQPALQVSQPALQVSQPALQVSQPTLQTPQETTYKSRGSGSTKPKSKPKPKSKGSGSTKRNAVSHAKPSTQANIRGYHRPGCQHGQQMKITLGRISQKKVRVVKSHGHHYLVCRACRTIATNPVPAAAVKHMST